MKQQLQQIHLIPPVERYRIISGLDRSISPPAEIYLDVYIYQCCPLEYHVHGPVSYNICRLRLWGTEAFSTKLIHKTKLYSIFSIKQEWTYKNVCKQQKWCHKNDAKIRNRFIQNDLLTTTFEWHRYSDIDKSNILSNCLSYNILWLWY